MVTEKLLQGEMKISRCPEAAILNKTANSTSKKASKCFECGKEGHMRKNCRVFLKKKSEHKDTKVNCAKAGADAAGYVSYGLTVVVSALSHDNNRESWIVDSGATRHMCNDCGKFDNLSKLGKSIEVKVGDGRVLHATAVGNVSVKVIMPDQQINECKLNNVLFVSDLAFNLISVSQFTSEGNNFIFCDNNCKLLDDLNNVLAVGTKLSDLYYLNAVSATNVCSVGTDTNIREDLWHKRFCHIHKQGLKKILSEKLVEGLDISSFKNLSFCESCTFGKQHRQPFPKQIQRRCQVPLELIHSDMCVHS